MPGSTSRPLTAALLSRDVIAPGIVDLMFALRDPTRLDFRAGQFVSIVIGQDPSGTVLKRSYSIASPSDRGENLRIIARIIPTGAASEFLMRLPIGDEVRMTGPHGFFVLDAAHPGDVVMGATGTGVAAVMPMLGELARQPAGGRRYLHWGARHVEDLFARPEVGDLCRAAGTELSLWLTQPPPGWSAGRGRITQAIVDQLPALAAPTFYLVGNGGMISELKAALVARGINRKKQIRTEAFFD